MPDSLSECERAVGAAGGFIGAALAEGVQPYDLPSDLHARFPQASLCGEGDANPWFRQVTREFTGVSAVRD